jgi:hypothetical protein
MRNLNLTRNRLLSSASPSFYPKEPRPVSVIIDSLKAQNAFLQGEVERFSNAVDNLSVQLADAKTRLAKYEQAQPDRSAMVPADQIGSESSADLDPDLLQENTVTH